MEFAKEVPGFRISLQAGADLQLYQYHVVDIDSNGDIDVSASGENVVGILQDTPDDNQIGCVMVNGVSFCKYGGEVAIGDSLTPSDGKLVKTTSTGDVVVGKALCAGGDGDRGSVLLTPGAKY